MMKREFTAVYKKTGKWFSAWIEEIPGVNTQGRTRKEAQDNLKEALLLTLAAHKEIGNKGKERGVYREFLSVRVPA